MTTVVEVNASSAVRIVGSERGWFAAGADVGSRSDIERISVNTGHRPVNSRRYRMSSMLIWPIIWVEKLAGKCMRSQLVMGEVVSTEENTARCRRSPENSDAKRMPHPLARQQRA